MNLSEKLEQLSSSKPSRWQQKAEWRKENRTWLKKSAFIALRVLEALRQQGLTQRELAVRMNVSAQQVNKIVRGQENLTMDTLDKLERALNIRLLHDGKTEIATMIDFGKVPAALKMYGGGMYHGFCFYSMHSFVSSIPSTSTADQPFIIGSDLLHLHNQYPIIGKEKWLQRHSEHS